MRREWIYAWLLLLPAMIILIGFTHLPALETIINSFFSTGRGRRPSVFVGTENYERLLADPVFIKALLNNLVYAAVTIPASIILALIMAVFVNEKREAARSCAWRFSRRQFCP